MRTAILLFLNFLPVCKEDVGDSRKSAQLEQIADAIDYASEGNRRIAAILIAIGYSETRFSLRIHDGHCHSWECDHGRARGPWQTWQNGMARAAWSQMRGLENTEKQAEYAAERIQIGLKHCGTVRGAMANYMGLACDSEYKEVDRRFEWYRRAYRALKENSQ